MATRPTKKQLDRWTKIRGLGCIVGNCPNPNVEIHHCFAEAKQMQERFLRRFGEDYSKYATLKYEEWVNGNRR